MEETVNITDLLFKYPSGFTLSIDKLDISSGLTLLVGPNGSGKTTLTYLLLGLLKPLKGSIKVLGMDPVKDSNELIKRVSYCFEDTQLPPHLVVGDIIEYLGSEGIRLARELEIYEYSRHTFSSLSSGNRRKLVLLTCLAKEADLYIVDEPFASLDFRSKLLVSKILNRNSVGKTILVSTHEVVNLYPKDVIFMVDGSIVKVMRDYKLLFEAVIESPDGKMLTLKSVEMLNQYIRDGYRIMSIRMLGLFDQLYTE